MLAQNVKRRLGEKMMNIGNAAVQRILYRNEAKIDRSIANGGERILERCGGDRLAMRQCLARCGMGK